MAAVVVVVMLLAGGEEYEVTAEFQNASQLVKGNEVVVGGAAVGTVKEIELGPDGQALVTFTVDEEYAPLRRGTVATVRSSSLSRSPTARSSSRLPADSRAGEEIPDGGDADPDRDGLRRSTSTSSSTRSTPKTVKDFKHVIQGFELSYEGVGRAGQPRLQVPEPVPALPRGGSSPSSTPTRRRSSA